MSEEIDLQPLKDSWEALKTSLIDAVQKIKDGIQKPDIDFDQPNALRDQIARSFGHESAQDLHAKAIAAAGNLRHRTETASYDRRVQELHQRAIDRPALNRPYVTLDLLGVLCDVPDDDVRYLGTDPARFAELLRKDFKTRTFDDDEFQAWLAPRFATAIEAGRQSVWSAQGAFVVLGQDGEVVQTIERPTEGAFPLGLGTPWVLGRDFQINDRITQDGWRIFFTIEWIGDELFGVAIDRGGKIERTMSSRRQEWKLWNDGHTHSHCVCVSAALPARDCPQHGGF